MSEHRPVAGKNAMSLLRHAAAPGPKLRTFSSGQIFAKDTVPPFPEERVDAAGLSFYQQKTLRSERAEEPCPAAHAAACRTNTMTMPEGFLHV